MRLTIELVPKTSWYSNVRSNVTRAEWDVIRKKVYKDCNNRCSVCGDTSRNQGKNYDLEAHEIWEYDDENLVQSLKEIVGLCNYCHTVKHPGLANILGRSEIVRDQLMKVNKMTYQEAMEYIKECFEIWNERSKHTYKLDIKKLDEYIIQ